MFSVNCLRKQIYLESDENLLRTTDFYIVKQRQPVDRSVFCLH